MRCIVLTFVLVGCGGDKPQQKLEAPSTAPAQMPEAPNPCVANPCAATTIDPAANPCVGADAPVATPPAAGSETPPTVPAAAADAGAAP